MADIARNAPYLQNVLRDGQPDGTIVPQDVRDLVVSTLSATVGIAASGTTQGTAATMASVMNVITTVASGSGVILTAGVRTMILNRGANPLLIYPPVGGQLEALGTNAAFTLQPGADATILFDPLNPTQGYISVLINAYSLSTNVPAVAGIIWNDSGVMSIS